MRFIRNKGKLIICGGTGKIDRNKNYPAIYQKVKDILLDDVYSNELFYAKCNYIDISRNKLSFFYNDRFGNRIKEFNKRIIKRFEEFNSLKKIPDIAREIFLNSISDEYAYESKWEYHIFEKFARLKKPIPGYMKKRHLVSKIQAMPFPSGIGNHFQ